MPVNPPTSNNKEFFMSEYIPTLAAQFEVLLDQLDNTNLTELSDFDINLIRLLSMTARDALNVAKEELDAVESQFTQQVSKNIDDLFSCVYEKPSNHVDEILKQQQVAEPEWVQLSVVPPELPDSVALEFRIKEIQINEMHNLVELKTVALQLLQCVRDASKNELLYRQLLADLMFPDIAAMRNQT